jgi:hypothetical protein
MELTYVLQFNTNLFVHSILCSVQYQSRSACIMLPEFSSMSRRAFSLVEMFNSVLICSVQFITSCSVQ